MICLYTHTHIYIYTHTHTHIYIHTSDQIRSVSQSCLTLRDPMNHSMPGLTVHHHLPEFTQTHVHRVSHAILILAFVNINIMLFDLQILNHSVSLEKIPLDQGVLYFFLIYGWKRLWCWKGLGAGREGDDRGWDGWMALLTWWMWVCVNSERWWWTGRPGVLRFMGSQRVGHDWATERNWWNT